MRSSTSSSNTRIPDIPYRIEWCFILLLVFGFIVSSEFLYRYHGHLPSVVDSNRFWAIHRSDVYSSNGQKRIVIAGASRAQLGLVPSVIRESFPHYRIKQLTIDGTSSFEVVKGLCEDPDFDGIILWSTNARALSAAQNKEKKDFVYSKFFQNDFQQISSMERNLNCYISAFLQNYVVILSPSLTLRKLLGGHLKFKPSYISMTFDRYRSARYFSIMSESQRNEHRLKRLEIRRKSQLGTISITKFKDFIETDLSRLYGLLHSRGGKLILLRMPTTDEHWTMDEESAPKELFWDRIFDLSGIPTIHFRDYPELMEFDCPDASHLDWSDAPEFTRRLSQILKVKIEANRSNL